jgi:hypothetical protein
MSLLQNEHAQPLFLITNRKIKKVVNQRLRLLNGIAVRARPAAAAAKIGLNIAYLFWLGFLQVCDACPWSGHNNSFRAARSGAFCIALSSLQPRKPVAVPARRPCRTNPTPAIHMPGTMSSKF